MNPLAVGLEARAVPVDGLVPRVALALRPKNREPDDERERFRAKGLRLLVDALPVVPRPAEVAPVVAAVPRFGRNQVEDEPEAEREFRKFDEPDEEREPRKLEELRRALDTDGALRAPERLFDLQLNWDVPEDRGAKDELPREPKKELPVDRTEGADARGAEKLLAPPPKKPRPPAPRDAPWAGASDANTPQRSREKRVSRSFMTAPPCGSI